MIKSKLIHPEIIGSLAAAGHGAQVLIADGNYPFSVKSGANAELVFLNLAPGLLKVTDVLKVLKTAIPIEAAAVMDPGQGTEPPIFNEFRKILGPELELGKFGRFEFYDEASSFDTCLVIATGEKRLFANILLTIGVVK